MTKYLNVNVSDGKLYEYSKEKKEGFDAHFNSKGELKGYRKYQSNVIGEFVSVVERKNPNLNNQLEFLLTLKDSSGEYNVVTISAENMRGNYSNYAESLIRHLPFLKKGTIYKTTFFNFIPKDSDKKISGISFKTSDDQSLENLKQIFNKKDGGQTDGDIPAIEWKVIKGKNVPNSEAQQSYLYEVFSKYATTRKPISEPIKEETKAEETKKEVVKKEAIVVSDEDDLPF